MRFRPPSARAVRLTLAGAGAAGVAGLLAFQAWLPTDAVGIGLLVCGGLLLVGIPTRQDRDEARKRRVQAQGPEGPALLLPDEGFWGRHTVSCAETVLNDYKKAKTKYAMSTDHPAGTADCTTFVHDALAKAGYVIPYMTTDQILNDGGRYFEERSGEGRPGDVIVQANAKGGHAGIFTGLDKRGRPEGLQWGVHGGAKAPFGPKGWFKQYGPTVRYFTPKWSAR